MRNSSKKNDRRTKRRGGAEEPLIPGLKNISPIEVDPDASFHGDLEEENYNESMEAVPGMSGDVSQFPVSRDDLTDEEVIGSDVISQYSEPGGQMEIDTLNLSDLNSLPTSPPSSPSGSYSISSNETSKEGSVGGRRTRKTRITRRTRKYKRKTRRGSTTKKVRKTKRSSKGKKGRKRQHSLRGGCYGTGVGANNYEPNYSIYNTDMLKLFPYKP